MLIKPCQVRKALEVESVNQVGSFVWTHLTNLMKSSSPHKQGLRDILEDEKLKTEFNMDKRKFSRNYEISYFSEKFGTGAMAESNVIFSSSSFVPRSDIEQCYLISAPFFQPSKFWLL